MSDVVISIATTAIVLRQHTWPNGTQILSPGCTVILLLVVASIATPPIVLLQRTWPSGTPAVSATALFKVHFNCSNSASLAYLS